MLSNFDINRICRKLDLPIVGVFNKDELPVEKKIGSYYVNMENANAGSGTHWVMFKIYCPDDRSKLFEMDEASPKVCKALYFDSFGIGYPKEVEEYLKPFGKVAQNMKHIQNIRSSQCGWYCIACDYFIENDGGDYLDSYEDFLNMWSEEPNDNLKILKDYFKPL
jgi:hypothetical protein